MKDCLICNRIDKIKQDRNPYIVTELETGYVVVGDYQFFWGYTLFLCKEHKKELHELESNFKNRFLEEMSLVAEAVYRAFKPRKLNYELLGNTDEHLHWHLFPRHADDPNPKGPLWQIDKSIRCGDATRPTEEQLTVLKTTLLHELNKLSLKLK